jgi:hypothetical protein
MWFSAFVPLFAAFLLMQSPQPAPAPATPQQASPQPPKSASESKAKDADRSPDEKLLRVKRIYVDGFGEDSIAKQIQATIIDSLNASKRFVVTENKEKADAILRGTGLEKTSQEVHAHSEATAVGTAAGSQSGSLSGSGGTISGSSSGGFVAHSAAIEDSNFSTETINDARVAVRLVDRDGDVIWSTTQESKNAKYKSSSTDVAEKVVKRLLWDLEKLEKKQAESSDAKSPQ